MNDKSYTPWQVLLDNARESERDTPLIKFLWYHNQRAIDKVHITEPRLYATRDSRRVRVTMASRLGDVGITSYLDSDNYNERVPISELSEFSDTPYMEIPIKAAQEIAHRYGFDQIVIIGRKTGDTGCEHVTTYGINKDHCDVAGKIGDFLKYKIMGWDK